MINNYDKFRSELILEACLSMHNQLLDRLSRIGKGGGKSSEIASEIVDYIYDEEWLSSEDIKQDFFNVTSSNDKLSFLQSNKTSSEPYESSSRGEIKVGRALRYICDLYEINYSDKDIEDLVNKFKSVSESDVEKPKFEIYSGEEIKVGYNTNNYYSELGTLGDSCMNDEFDYLDIYSKNKNVRLLVLMKDKSITGRALVWKLDKSPCNAKYFMDRVYVNYQHDVNTFTTYAEENGWMYKSKMSYGCDEAVKFKYKNADVFGEIRVKLDGDHDEYPFLDTLQFLTKKRDELSNIPSWKCRKLDDTDGECEKCCECNGKSENDDLCHYCSGGVTILKEKGIKVNVERRRK